MTSVETTQRTALVALAGNPNTGKSTLFNHLAGARQRVMNVPRTTVEVAQGPWRHHNTPGQSVTVVDLPGAYDIVHGSPDEVITAAVLDHGLPGTGHVDAVIVTIDATAPARSLLVLAQVAQRAVPVVIALTMTDVAAARGSTLDPQVLENAIGAPVLVVDPRRGQGIDALGTAVAAAIAGHTSVGIGSSDDDALEWAFNVAGALPKTASNATTLSDKIDKAVLNPWIGIPAFMAVLWAMFQLVTWVAAPLIDGVDALWNGPVLNVARQLIPGEGWWEAAFVDGILAGCGAVLSFVPLMALAFAGFAVLEDSGYLARASFVTDKALRSLGLDGRATLPLILGYGCNLPALAALKVIPDARQRIATALLIPFTSCSARLPVYLLLAGTFFPEHAGTAVFCMYIVSAVMIIGASAVMKGTMLKGASSLATVTVLPAYQRPQLKSIARSIWARLKAFVTQAGTVIVSALAVVWLIAAVPATGEHSFGDVPVADSVYAVAAQSVSPAFAPLGFDDWRATSALATGLVAKELVVAAFAQSYALDESATNDIETAIHATFDASSGGHAGAAAAAFMVFVALYTPCFATLGELKRSFGTRWMLTSVGLGLLAAYSAAALIFQIGSRL